MDNASEDVVGATGDNVLSSEEVTGASEEVTGAIEEVTGATEEVTGATEEVIGATEEATGVATEKVTDSIEEVTGETEEVAGATEEVTETTEDVISPEAVVDVRLEGAVDTEEVTEPNIEGGLTEEQQEESGAPAVSREEDDVSAVRPDKAALQFLQCIDPDILELCMFEEKLVNISPEGDHVGEFKASVEKTEVGKEELLLVQASSNGKVEDIPMRTSITAYLKPKDLSIVKQEHLEFIKIPGHELEKRTDMELSSETGQLIIKRKTTQGGKIRKSGFKIPKEKLAGFVTEGTSVILERLMIKTCEENEEFSFVSSDANSARLVPTVFSWY